MSRKILLSDIRMTDFEYETGESGSTTYTLLIDGATYIYRYWWDEHGSGADLMNEFEVIVDPDIEVYDPTAGTTASLMDALDVWCPRATEGYEKEVAEYTQRLKQSFFPKPLGPSPSLGAAQAYVPPSAEPVEQFTFTPAGGPLISAGGGLVVCDSCATSVSYPPTAICTTPTKHTVPEPGMVWTWNGGGWTALQPSYKRTETT